MDVLIIEDNVELATNIGAYLYEKGHSIDYAHNGITGYQLMQQNQYDAIILDLMLPGMDGITLCKKYLENNYSPNTSILMLTARDTVPDIVEGLSAGADDYLVKPFSLEVLAARLDALHRRMNRQEPVKIIKVDDLEINLETREVKRSSEQITLKPTTAKILEYLMRNTHRVVTRGEIEKHIWNDDIPLGDPLRSHIYSIRQAVDKNYPVKLIHTMHGVGYRVAKLENDT